MFLKSGFTVKEKSGVTMANGTVATKGVKLNVYCYTMDGVLIDTGSKTLEQELIPFFDTLDIDKVVITHYHEDHTGCASYLQKGIDVPIFMDETNIGYCEKKADYPLYRKMFWGKREPFQASPIGTNFISRNATWDVIQTPGHSNDHLSFLNRETGQLFTGDLFCGVKTKVVLKEENIPQIIQSLQRVLTYDFDEVFCSHAGYLKDGRKLLQRKLDYLLELQDNILTMYQGGKSAKEITADLFPKKYPITYFSFGEWSSKHIVDSVLKSYLK